MFSLKKKEKAPVAEQTQGVFAGRPTLLIIAATAGGALLLAVAALSAYLLLVREPTLQAAQIRSVSQAYADQQAASLEHFFELLEQRIAGASTSPLALSAVASQTDTDVRLVEQAIADYFPELSSLRLIVLGNLGTADLESGSQGLRNHIEVDLVRRVAAGEKANPESYTFEGARLTSIAQHIVHPRIDDRSAVILASVDNASVIARLNRKLGDQGMTAVEQLYRRGSSIDRTLIATQGRGELVDYSSSAPVGAGWWEVSFTPDDAMISELAVDTTLVWIFSGIVLVVGLGGLAFFVIMTGRTLEQQVERVIANADKRTPLALDVPQLIPLAKFARRATYRATRQGSRDELFDLDTPDTPGDTGMADPMFQSADMIVEHDDLELDLSADADEPDSTSFPRHIFRAYDIRGQADTELTDELVMKIGGALGTWASELNQQSLLVACDGRLSSPRIKTALVKALLESGRDVIDLGEVPTPLLYFATQHLECQSGVMITGSHNPGSYNGLKIILNQETIADGGIAEIRERVLAGEFSRGSGHIIREDIVPAYLDEVVSDIAIADTLRIVIDAGNGITGAIAPTLFEELGCEVIPLYCDVDGNFPNHDPDTSNENNLKDLVNQVRMNNADFGVAFDGDGDRLAVVTRTGKIVRSDRLLMLFAEDVVSRNPGADVVFDVKCSRELTQLISRQGGRPVLWKTGHAFMKQKMRETGALLGGEFSGHMFFGERWFGFDDGMYAAGRLAEILSTGGESLDDVLVRFPQTVSTPEILVPIPEQHKFTFMNQLAEKADFSPGKVNTLDGIRVDYADGWGLLRASNTTAALTARFEATDERTLEAIKQAFRDQVQSVNSSLEFNV